MALMVLVRTKVVADEKRIRAEAALSAAKSVTDFLNSEEIAPGMRMSQNNQDLHRRQTR